MEITIPSQLESNFTPVNSLAEEADRHALSWAERLGLTPTSEARRRHAATRPGILAGYCYPYAKLADLRLIAEWMTWLFVLDDQNDEGRYGHQPDVFEKALTSLLAPDRPTIIGNPLHAGLTDIIRRAGNRMSESWRLRFHRHVADYFTANVWQAAHRHLGETPDLDSFPQMRRAAGAVMPSFDLIEFVRSTTLPARIYYSRTYQRLLLAAADVVCWTNDLMSLEKEIAHGDDQNLVIVLHKARGISLLSAADEVTARTQQRLNQFLDAERELDDLCDRLRLCQEVKMATHACAAMLKAWMSGHVAWGRSTGRYLEIAERLKPAVKATDLLRVTSARVDE